MKKKVVLLTVLLLLLAGLVAFALFGDTIMSILNPVRNDWYEDSKTGIRYFMNEESDPVSGWFDHGGNRYYLDPAREGAMHTGWLELDGKTYYMNAEGHMTTGWQNVDGSDYYFDADGSLHTGWLQDGGRKLYLDEEGHPAAGWLEMPEGKYHLDEGGVVATGWLELDGAKYYFNDTGLMLTGWLTLDEGTYYLNEQGNPATGWLELDGSRYYLDETGMMHTGWLEDAGARYYLNEDGTMHTGWLEADGARYYLKEDGTIHTGWLELDGQKYYLKEDGTPAVGKLVIEEKTYYFTSTGANIILVNRWNEIPEDYEIELKQLPNGRKIAAECYDALMQMVNDCTANGCHPEIIGANRTMGDQRALFNNKIAYWQEQGMSYSSAYARTMQQVAIPGTSEHQLGLAVDILDKYYPKSYTGDNNCLVWLNEHCWEYGFIIRYPDDKTDITGIIFEPWHYRYVGVELAMELKDSGLCLEEYLDQLTNDGTTCGNPDAVSKSEE